MAPMRGTLHPAVPHTLGAWALLVTMASVQPVFVVLSWGGALADCAYSCGLRGVTDTLKWQLPLAVLIIGGNFLLATQGETVLFRLGTRAFTLESLLYGLVMAGMLSAALFWFQAMSAWGAPDSALSLLGSRAPAAALAASTAWALVPQFVRRGKAVGDVTRANSCARQKADVPPKAVSEGLRTLGVLLGWGLEDSLVRATSCKARGWGSGRRTRCRRRPLRSLDIVALLVISMLGVVSMVCGVTAATAFSYYPSWSGWAPAPYYLPWALLCLVLPAYALGGAVRERVRGY